MFQVSSIRFGNFGRFVDEQTLSFDDLPKINQVDGKNLNTGGSSAAAKTTLLRVLDYGFGINRVPATVLQSRLTKDHMFAEIKGLWNGSPTSIYRSKGDLRVTGMDPKTGEAFSITGNSALAEEKIDQIIELPRELFKKITHKEQGEGGFFLNMTPKEAYEFMLKSLGLSDWLIKMEKAEQDAATIRPSIVQLEANFNAASSNEVTAQTRLDGAMAVSVPEEPDTSYLENITARQREIKTELAAIESERKTKVSELDAKQPQQPVFKGEWSDADIIKAEIEINLKAIKERESAKIEKLTKIRDSIQSIKQQAKSEEAILLGKRSAIFKINSDLSALRNLIITKEKVESDLKVHSMKKCPTCLQDWKSDGSSVHFKLLSAKLAEIEQAEKVIVDLEGRILSAQEEIPKEEADLESLRAKQTMAEGIADKVSAEDPAAALKVDLETNKAALRKIEETMNEQKRNLNDRYNSEMIMFFSIKKKIEDQFSERRNSLSVESTRLTGEARILENVALQYKNAIEIRTKDLERANQDLQTWKTSSSTAKSKLSDAKNKLALYEDAKRLIKGYTMSMFQEVLDQVGTKASETICKIPNMATATISFEPFKEVKGKIKDEIVATISMDGEEGIPIKSLCGGERNVADVAVDLAVIDMIEERTGIGSNYYILDEPTTALDDVCKIEFMEALKACASNKRLFIVEHSQAIKEMADHTITVERSGLTARIV